MTYAIVAIIIFILMILGLLATVRPGKKWLLYPIIISGILLTILLVYLVYFVT